MPGHCPNGFGVAFAVSQPTIEAYDMALLPTLLMERDNVGGLDVGPFEVVIDVRA
jgi:hypothetical protein